MAQHRQPGPTFSDNDQVSVTIRPASKQSRPNHHRRFKSRRISVTTLLLLSLTLISFISISAFFFFSNNNDSNDKDKDNDYVDRFGTDLDFLTNVTRTERSKILKFGHGVVGHGRDSRYWDKDDRRRDEDYGEDLVSRNDTEEKSELVVNDGAQKKRRPGVKVGGLYNEAGRNELKRYEAEFEASLNGGSVLKREDKSVRERGDEQEVDDEYGDEIDMHDIRLEDYNSGVGNERQMDENNVTVDETTRGLSEDALDSDEVKTNGRHVNVIDEQSSRRSISEKKTTSKKRPKRRKYSGVTFYLE